MDSKKWGYDIQRMAEWQLKISVVARPTALNI